MLSKQVELQELHCEPPNQDTVSVSLVSRVSSVSDDARKIVGVETVPPYASAGQGSATQLMVLANVHQVNIFLQKLVKHKL